MKTLEDFTRAVVGEVGRSPNRQAYVNFSWSAEGRTASCGECRIIRDFSSGKKFFYRDERPYDSSKDARDNATQNAIGDIETHLPIEYSIVGQGQGTFLVYDVAYDIAHPQKRVNKKPVSSKPSNPIVPPTPPSPEKTGQLDLF